MENISTTAELKEAIQLLEAEKSVHLQVMRENFSLASESFKPANLIRYTMKEVVSSPYLLPNIFNMAMGMFAGHFLKRTLFIGSSNKYSKKLLGSMLQFGITNLVVKAPNAIKSFARKIFSNKKKEINSE